MKSENWNRYQDRTQKIFNTFPPPRFIWWFSITSTMIIILALLFLPAKAASYDVRDYGAVGDGRTNDRTAIQSAIDSASASGGGEVILDGSKTYLSGHLRLKSGVTLVIEAGSQLVASTNVWDFEPNQCVEDNKGNCECGDLMAPLIFADNVTNVGVRGAGIIRSHDGTMVGNASAKFQTFYGKTTSSGKAQINLLPSSPKKLMKEQPFTTSFTRTTG